MQQNKSVTRHAPTSPKCNCLREVDFSDSIIRDVLIAGIADLDIRRDRGVRYECHPREGSQ